MSEPVRTAQGAFNFRIRLLEKAEYSIEGSTNLRNWIPLAEGSAPAGSLDYVHSEASKVSSRFYRVMAGKICSRNVLGYACVTAAPGFSMIANPLESSQTVGEIFKDWPEGTTLNKFDTEQCRLTENGLKDGQWSNPSEKLAPGEGAILFNPSQVYKTVNFVGEVKQGQLSVLIPAGFSVRSSLVPQVGNLAEDLGFPIANGDIIHVFDMEHQKYVLHPYEGGKWSAGAPVLSIGESFWVAKNEPGNWTRNLLLSEGGKSAPTPPMAASGSPASAAPQPTGSTSPPAVGPPLPPPRG